MLLQLKTPTKCLHECKNRDRRCTM